MTKRIRTKSTTEQLREILDKTDAVLIGAGAGLSTSAGFVSVSYTHLDVYKRQQPRLAVFYFSFLTTYTRICIICP